jgi:iron complex outermembrane receptor protein
MRALSAVIAVSAMLSGAAGAHAQGQGERPVRLAISQSVLTDALNEWAQLTGYHIIAPHITSTLAAPRLEGSFTPRAALEKLLEGTPLTYELLDARTVAIRERAVVEQKLEDSADGSLEEIVVTGSHIRGAQSPSPVLTLTSRRIGETGMADLGEVVRSIPQNFNGGQNPGVMVGASGGSIKNQNATGASSPNLRGLGPDATLTLLNGRRLSYGSFSQGVDISAIPLDAIERVDFLLDGASAIYGSDAVAGVVNVVLKPEYDGISATARYGEATHGGFVQQGYSLVGGNAWDGGGFALVGDYKHETAVYGRQRGHTEYLVADPPLRSRESVVARAQWRLRP